MSWFKHDFEDSVDKSRKPGYQPPQAYHGDTDKEREKQQKADRQRLYLNQLQQQVHDKQERKQAQKEHDDSQKYGEYFRSGAPKLQRDITNPEEGDVLEVEKLKKKEKQEQYARELAAQLEESNFKKAHEKHQRRQPSVGPTENHAEKAKREKTQIQRDYAEYLQEHLTLQNQIKQQQKEKEQYEDQFTGLDIRGAYKYKGPSQEQVREELAKQIQEKEYLKQGGFENREAYVREDTADYGKQAYGKKVAHVPSGNQKVDIFGNPAHVRKGSVAKENAPVDIFGNPSRQSTKTTKPLNYDIDIFGNPAKRR